MTREVCEHFNPVDQPCAKCEEKRKSEALFLADELEIPLGTVIQSEVCRRAAKELRRLHAELERCKQVCAATSEAWRKEAALAEDVATHGSAWSKNGKRIDPMSVYAEPVQEPPCATRECMPSECPNCASLQDQNTELDRKLAEMEQTSLELCETCGWRTLIPGDCCLNCVRPALQEPTVKESLQVPAEVAATMTHRCKTHVPLTEEEIEKLLIESAGMTVQFSDVDLRLARAIERAHGIGGDK